MIVGVPKEVKKDEYRVALLPVGADELVRAGHVVLVQQDAGKGSGIADDQYREVGAEIVVAAEEIWSRADMIVVIEHGRISQTGTHAELMSKDGKYRSMVEQQIHMTLGGFTTAAEIDAGATVS